MSDCLALALLFLSCALCLSDRPRALGLSLLSRTYGLFGAFGLPVPSVVFRAADALPAACFSGHSGRLQGLERPEEAGPAREGVAALIAFLGARISSGGDLVEAFEEAAGRSFATRRITVGRAAEVVSVRCFRGDEEDEVDLLAAALHAIWVLTARTGCPPAGCLDMVSRLHRRLEAMAEARSSAFAMPRATVRLLSFLPAFTVLLGEFMGAAPLSFLLKPGPGTACLLLGGCLYLSGLMWMDVLLKDAGGVG